MLSTWLLALERSMRHKLTWLFPSGTARLYHRRQSSSQGALRHIQGWNVPEVVLECLVMQAENKGKKGALHWALLSMHLTDVIDKELLLDI